MEAKLASVIKQRTYGLILNVETPQDGKYAIRLVGEWTNFRKMLADTKELRKHNPRIEWVEL
jgi:hypothetical protein